MYIYMYICIYVYMYVLTEYIYNIYRMLHDSKNS